MTVTSTSVSITHSCNGGVDYPFTFGVGGKDEVLVTLIDSLEAETVLVVDVDYTVVAIPIDWDALGAAIRWDWSLGGTVTTVVAYAVGNQIQIRCSPPKTQEQAFTEGMATLYKNFEWALDKLTRIALNQDARIVALEAAVLSPGGGASTITYLGKLVANPDTSGWGADEALTVWCLLVGSVYKVMFWDGENIRMMG